MRKNILLLLFCLPIVAAAQDFYSFNHAMYDDAGQHLHALTNETHTSVKPLSFDYKLMHLRTPPIATKFKTLNNFLGGRFYSVEGDDFKLQINPLFNFSVGKEDNQKTFVNTRAVEVKGQVGHNVSFYSSFYENQAVLPHYVEDYIWNHELTVPGQGESKWYDRTLSNTLDFSMANGHVSYQASKHFDFQFGHGKHFIGDGYRSLLLSDNSFNYPYLKVTTNFWKIKYVNLFSSYQDLRNEFAIDDVNRKKFSTIHYLSYNLSRRLNIGLFEAIIWEQDTMGRTFDVNYLNPIIFYRPIEFSLGSRGGNALMGVSLKFKITDNAHLYSQFIIDEFKISELKARNGWWANKYAGQFGGKWFDVLGVKNLFVQSEFNFARPFMYSHHRALQSYTHYNQPLAHPLGASFLENVSFVRYRYSRWYAEMKALYAIHGGEITGDQTNYGSDVLTSYNEGVRMETGNEIAQGNTTALQIIDFKIGMLINPVTNMKLEVGVMDRSTTSEYTDPTNTTYLYVGFKTDLRNLYYDF